MTVIADFTQLTALATQLAGAPTRLAVQSAAVVREGVQRGRDEAQDQIRSQIRGRYLPHYANSITASVMNQYVGEFGPDSALPQGAFGRGVEYGSSNAPPLAHMRPAADALERAFPADVAEVAVDSLW